MELKSSSHGYGQLVYHFEWTPKYRYEMFRKSENAKLCEEIIREVANRWQIAILELSVMPDHIHCAAGLRPTMPVSKALNILKGASAYELFRRQPKFRLRYPKGHIWSEGKFYRTVGDIDLQTTINYVREQKEMCQMTLAQFAN